ncbi:type I secretion system permease/ATPase [Bradyrhizobium sp. ISRA443]|uniref:type I secretion system permease/ATPase n=1 Tax=unclassified Bradyrhizobium TaxID=2631580 RepID=UPI00247897C6|nr:MULTISPECIES: type I secretion system permease/ATPase [unclassified Bradyrhizobium]WGS02036.1 type I secretion system permease/ATPase [Bradyrhizobium sp. ISRA436]WGS08921.1 type I secretion system permease/ATPase [Bradyrhizobium sp. ISRA437]WGS15810.1 type I secretion system permease/ATPase [Bradyrhizobium sp. ISRA443]
MDKWGIGSSSDTARTGENARAPNVLRFDPRAARHDAVAAPDELGEVRTSNRADIADSGPAVSQLAERRHPQVHSKDPQASPPVTKGGESGAAVNAAGEERKVSNSGGSNGGGTRSGGGGGGGSSPLQKATGGDEYRETLSKGLASIKRNFLTIGIFSFVVNLLALSIPIYLFNMSDRVLTSRSIDTLIMLTTIVIFAIAAHVLMDMMRRFILMRVAVDTEARLGGPVLSAAAKAAQSGSSREFQTLADLQQLRSFMTGPVLLTMFDAPIAPIYLIVVFLIHPQLGLIVTVAGLGLTGLALLNQHVTADPFTRASAFVTRANLQAEAMARNAQVINAMGMIPEGVRVWGQETVESLKAQVIAQDRNILMTGLSKFLRLGTQISILGWGAVLALEAHLTGGMIIAASIVSSRALAPLEGTIEGWRSYVHARSAYQRIKTLLQNTPLNLRRLRLPRPEGRLSVERILYVPPPTKKVILNGVSFQLDPGESLAIVGPSGTGKTMLARMLVGSIIPTAGNVRLDLMDLRNWDPRQFGECVGYLPQDVQLFPASIKANIARMREDARDADIFDAAETADVHEMIAEFPQGYETVIGMDGSPLSGGQRQRIGLARAFYGSPRLVVLDEPNANLDTSGELALAKALMRAKQKGTTIVAVTQRPALLQSVDKIMILQNGSVQAFGARDEMIHLLSGRKPPSGGGPSPGGAPILDA